MHNCSVIVSIASSHFNVLHNIAKLILNPISMAAISHFTLFSPGKIPSFSSSSSVTLINTLKYYDARV